MAIAALPEPATGEAASTVPDRAFDQTTRPLGAESTCQIARLHT